MLEGDEGEDESPPLPQVPRLTPDLVFVWNVFWPIRHRYPSGDPIPVDGIRSGLEMLGLLPDAHWIAPLLFGMDDEFVVAIHEAKSTG